MSVKCSYEYLDDGRLQMTANGFNRDITSFFQLKIPGYMSPRSTAPTDTFEFESLDESGQIIDYQRRGIEARATFFSDIKQIQIEPESHEVGLKDQTFTFTFVTQNDLKPSDIIRITLPKWNPQSAFPESYFDETEELVCQGIFNVKKKTNCLFRAGTQEDTITLISALVFQTSGAAEDEDLSSMDIPAGSKVSFKVGPVRNPLSTAPVQGIKIETLDLGQGTIQSGSQLLKINEATKLSAAES